MSIQSEIERIKSAKANIITSIEDKGVTVPEGTSIDNLSSYVGGIATPTGTIEIDENGEYDVTEFASANVNVSGGGSTPITYSGSYDSTGLAQLGYDAETIAWYNQNGVSWDSNNNNNMLVSQHDKNLYGVIEDKGGAPTTSNITVFGTSSGYRGSYRYQVNYLPNFDVKTNKTSLMHGLSGYVAMITIPKLDTSRIKTFSNCFDSCYNLTTIPLINTSLGTDFSNMFKSCRSLLKIPQLDTSSATVTSYMFEGCYSLKEIPNLDLSKVTTAVGMYSNCTSIEEAPKINFSIVKYINYLFNNCYKLRTITSFDTSQATDVSYMFNNCYALEKIPQLDFSKATTMSYLFFNCFNLKTIPQINTSNVTSFTSAFQNCYSLNYIPDIDISKATQTSNMFSGCYSLKRIPNLNPALSTSGAYMFAYCYGLKEIPSLNFPNATSLGYMFYTDYNLIKIDTLTTPKVTSMSNTFYYCKSLAVLDISGIDLSKVTTYTTIFTNTGTECKQSDGGYADGISYVIVKDEASQNWVLNNSNGRPSTWTTANVVIKDSANDPTLGG